MTIEGILRLKGCRVISIDGDMPVGAAICMMRHEKVGAMVVSRTGREVDGLVREHDLIRALKSHGVGRLLSMTVADIMCREVASCRPEEDLRRVMTRMSARKTHHMPVVNDDGLCGIVSMGEIVDFRLAEAEEEAVKVRESVSVPVS